MYIFRNGKLTSNQEKKLDIAHTGCPIKMCHAFKLIWQRYDVQICPTREVKSKNCQDALFILKKVTFDRFQSQKRDIQRFFHVECFQLR